MAQIEITADDIKGYLGITATTYDTQIGSVVTIWTNVVESWITTAYLEDSNLTETLKAGKLLVICGNALNVLPVDACGVAAGMAVKEKVGDDYEYTVDTKSSSANSLKKSGDGMIGQGLQILKPYLAADPFSIEQQIISTTSDYSPEFQLERRDSEGHIVESGNMGLW
jgi:hypothetical protein